MSRQEQLTLDNFFKSNCCTPRMEVRRKKKYNLSLSNTPTKSLKLMSEQQNVTGVMVISDDEDQETNTHNFSSGSASDSINSSDATVVYNIENLHTSPVTPKSNREFYSPNKKKSLKVLSPRKARRNLNLSLESDNIEDQAFIAVTEGLDDKTIFLMKIIYQCLNDSKMKFLMNENSINLLEKCMQVKNPGMTIVCRLYWQKERWCRWEKLKKNVFGKNLHVDDSTLQDAMNSLIESGLITLAQFVAGQTYGLSFDEIVATLKWNEVIEVCKQLKIKAKSKSAGIDALKKFMSKETNITNYFQGAKNNNENTALKLLGAKLGVCYKLSDQARVTLNELYILMYLGVDHVIIKEKHLELMLINEKSQKETYPIDGETIVDNASVVFKNRREFEQYLNARGIYDDFLVKTNSEEKCRIIESVFGLYKAIDKEDTLSYVTLPVWLRPYTPAHLYVKILEDGIGELKKTNVRLAIEILTTLLGQEIFRQHKKANWFEQKALILKKHMNDAEGAANVLLAGLTSNLPTEAKQLLAPRALQIANMKKNKVSKTLQVMLRLFTEKVSILEKNIRATHIYKVPIDSNGKGKIKFETWTAGEKTVREAEEQCIYEYITVTSKYTHGGHWEGRIVTTIFFLLFWDIIYARLRGLRGVFLTRYQLYPLDLLTDSFYTNRKLMIGERLQEIEKSTKEAMLSRMRATWQDRPESELSGIHRSIGWDNICAVGTCLGPRRVAAVCRRLATNYAHAHSGFPDLTLWNVHTEQIAFVEVKTDSDKPCTKQIQWLHYLEEIGVDVEFCYIGVHTMRSKSRNCMDSSDDDE